MTSAITAEVWGSPIGHSRSPDLHRACYQHLRIDGHYDKREVTEAKLGEAFVANRGALTGISLTMPLKSAILGLVRDHRGDVDTLQAANTAVRTKGQWWLANTDPVGARAMLTKLLPDIESTVLLLGAGATARSLVMGLSQRSFAGTLTVVARSAERATATLALAQRRGLSSHFLELDRVSTGVSASLVISTLPSGTALPTDVTDRLLDTGATLVDVGYHPWPTPLATAWLAAGLPVHSGLPMLMFQALAQLRAFAGGDITIALPDEAGVLLAMADAVDLDAVWADPRLMGE